MTTRNSCFWFVRDAYVRWTRLSRTEYQRVQMKLEGRVRDCDAMFSLSLHYIIWSAVLL